MTTPETTFGGRCGKHLSMKPCAQCSDIANSPTTPEQAKSWADAHERTKSQYSYEIARMLRSLADQIASLTVERDAAYSKGVRDGYAANSLILDSVMTERDTALALAADRLVDAERWRKVKMQRSDFHGDCYVMMFAPDGDFPPDAHEGRIMSAELPPLPEGECSEWLQNGKRVNAFPHPARPFTSYDKPYWEAKGYSCAPLFTADQMREYGQAWRNATLNDAVAICRAVSVQEIDGADTPYTEGRNMGATVCRKKIKELLK